MTGAEPGGGAVTISVVITPLTPAAAGLDDLAATGMDVAPLVYGAVTITLVGAVLLIIRRRRAGAP